ncbi:MAG: sigma-70 family RNA polymerase sigma factor [Chloroflexota bacterium]|nr:sigma-70 family RNA polymerase sigma factor [Chloroflexota bacterium]
MDDAHLLTSANAGDDAALRVLFERHAPWLAIRLARDLPVDAVEDVMQETFIAVWRGSSSYRGGPNAGGWVWGIAKRQSAKWYRDHGHRPDMTLLDESFADGRDIAATAAERIDMEHAIATLGPAGSADRETAQMIFVDDRPIAEVAERLGVPEGTVKSRVHRTRRLLQAALRPAKENGG